MITNLHCTLCGQPITTTRPGYATAGRRATGHHLLRHAYCLTRWARFIQWLIRWLKAVFL